MSTFGLRRRTGEPAGGHSRRSRPVRIGGVFVVLVMLAPSAGEAATTITRDALRDAYSRYDRAYVRSDPAGMSALYADRVTFTDADGHSESLGSERIRANNAFHIRSIAGERIVRQSQTEITRIATEASGAVVSLRRLEQVAQTDRNGTTGIAKATTSFDDVWRQAPSGPRVVEEHVHWLRTALDANPSPSALAAIANMRSSAKMLQDFNKGINDSYCTTSTQNERFDLETRRERCAQ